MASSDEPTPSTSSGNRVFTATVQPKLKGTTLLVYYPLPQPRLECPVKTCKQSWSTTKLNRVNSTNVPCIILHMTRLHKNPNKINIQNHCLVCKQVILEFNISLHPCLKNLTVPFEEEEVEHLPCRVEGCNRTFPSVRSRQSHEKFHRTHTAVQLTAASKKSKVDETPAASPSMKLPGSESSKTSTLDEASVALSSLTAPATPHAGKSDNEDYDDFMDTTDMDVDKQPEEVIDSVDMDVSNDEEPAGDLDSYLKNWITKLKDVAKLHVLPRRWIIFEKTMTEIILKVQKELKISDFWHTKHVYADINIKSQADIRKLYERNPKRAFNVLTGSKTLICDTPVNKIQEYYSSKMAAPVLPMDLSYFDVPTAADSTQYGVAFPGTAPFSSPYFTGQEVITRLKRFRNTAPGPDKIQYRHWLEVDPEGDLLAIIFNICQKYKKVPPSWKVSKTFLFAKNDDPSSLRDWRPISLLPTIYKLYSGLLSDRLRRWCTVNNIIHPSQKGGTEHDVILQHSFVLDHIIRMTKRNQHTLCLAFLDIQDAFPSTLTEAVLKALDASGAGDVIRPIVADIFADRTTEIICGEGTTQPIRIDRGLLMGDPISNFLFTLVLNFTILAVNRTTLATSPIPYCILADVDDLALFSKDRVDLQNKVNIISSSLAKVGLTLSSKKCVALEILGSTGTGDITIIVNGEPIRRLSESEHHTYIGVKIGFRKRNEIETPKDKFESLINKLVLTSKLGGWQIINALIQFVMPKINHLLRFRKISTGDWVDFDTYLRQKLKIAMNLPHYAPEGYIYGSRRRACLGFPNCQKDFHICKVVNAYKLMTSSDPVISEIVKDDLKILCRIKKNTTEEEMHNSYIDFLNGDFVNPSHTYESVWTRTRVASTNLNLKWVRSEEGIVSFSMDGQDIKVDQVKFLMKDIRERVKQRFSKDLMDTEKYTYIGTSMEAFALSSYSNHFFVKCRNNPDWQFIHRARLQLSPLLGCVSNQHKDSKYQICRKAKCREEADPPRETICHVLNWCNQACNTQRHNCIQDLLVKVLKENRFKVSTVDKTLPDSTSTMRPDILAMKGKKVYVIDVTCPFDKNIESLHAAAREKVNKYDKLAADWLNAHRDEYNDIQVVPFVIGSRGAWFPQNESFLSKVIISRKARSDFAKKCVSMVITWSRCIMNAHTGNRVVIVENGYPKVVDNLPKGYTFPSTVPPSTSESSKD